jgi:23S rRNA pseudouridine1911/1915/1917 synthase
MLLIDLLQKKFPQAKRTTLRRMLEEGRVRVNGGVVRIAKTEVGEGVKVDVDDRTRPVSPRYSLAPMEPVYEDGDVLVVNKPAGLLTSTVANEKRPTAIALIRRYLEQQDPKARAGVIHRLDRDASGLLVFSKNNGAYESLKSQFFHHTVERVYTAVVHGVPSPQSGRIENRLVELPDGSVRETKVDGKGERAVTEYETIEYDRKQKISLLKVTLHTGRKHQIRTHLAQRGTPILGDSVYGHPSDAPCLLLTATRLCFNHPRSGERLSFELPALPEVRALFPENA